MELLAEMDVNKKLCIGLDYDDTYSTNRPMWKQIVGLLVSHGCDVRFVTFRWETTRSYNNDDIVFDANNLDIPIIFCGGRQKEHVTKELGFEVDIWIDDNPVLIPSFDKLESLVEGCKINNDTKQRTNFSRYSDTTLVIE